MDSAVRRATLGDAILGVTLGLAFTAFGAILTGSFGVFIGVPIVAIPCLVASWIRPNRLLRVFALTLTAISLTALSVLAITNTLGPNSAHVTQEIQPFGK